MKLKKHISSAIVITALTCASNQSLAGAEDDPLLTKVMVNQLESDVRKGKLSSWSAQGWLGHDLHKLWIKTEGERVDSDTEESELQALYSRAIAPYWDLQLGIRKDLLADSSQEWGVIGLQGLAPYYFEIDAALFVRDNGDAAFRFEAEYELMLTQKLVLTPEVEFNFYGQNSPDNKTGSGLSNIEAGIRLRYEFIREIAPYIGINWSKSFGNTADFLATSGESQSETQIVVGLRAWF